MLRSVLEGSTAERGQLDTKEDRIQSCLTSEVKIHINPCATSYLGPRTWRESGNWRSMGSGTLWQRPDRERQRRHQRDGNKEGVLPKWWSSSKKQNVTSDRKKETGNVRGRAARKEEGERESTQLQCWQTSAEPAALPVSNPLLCPVSSHQIIMARIHCHNLKG